jgi:hypothetical protein
MCTNATSGGKESAAHVPDRRYIMTHRSTLYGLIGAAIVGMAGAACNVKEDQPLGVAEAAATAMDAHAHANGANSAAVNQWLAALRKETAHLQQFERAAPAGFDTKLLACMERAGEGGQGQHYGNMGRITKLEIEELAPEVVMYERQKNGREQLIAVEFIIPFALLPYSEAQAANPPSIRGVNFMPNHDLELWVLHVWLWKNNPSGMFANWNPDVSCQYAEDTP